MSQRRRIGAGTTPRSGCSNLRGGPARTTSHHPRRVRRAGVGHARNRCPTSRRGNLSALVRPVRRQRRRQRHHLRLHLVRTMHDDRAWRRRVLRPESVVPGLWQRPEKPGDHWTKQPGQAALIAAGQAIIGIKVIGATLGVIGACNTPVTPCNTPLVPYKDNHALAELGLVRSCCRLADQHHIGLPANFDLDGDATRFARRGEHHALAGR